MKVNIAVSAHNSDDWDRIERGDYTQPAAQPDSRTLTEALALGDLAEPLGFDGIWAPDHCGTPYSMTPNPLQMLAYFAGRTERISFGTIVVVLPWWNPVRLAHQIAYLDILSNGRYDMIGVGRGVSKFEFEALGIPREESRERFSECLDVLQLALSQERFSYEGQHFRIPETSVRPAPLTPDLATKIYAGSSTASSLEFIARRGLKPLFVGNKSLAEAAEDGRKVNAIRQDIGLEPCQPNNILFMYCAKNAAEVAEAQAYVEAANRDVRLHYGFGDPTTFAGVKGYEDYAAGQANATALTSTNANGGRPAVTRYDESNLLIGTPETIIERIQRGQKACSFAQIGIVPNFGTMPHHAAEASLRLFAQEVLPTVHRMEAPLHPAAMAPAPVG
jgi:alkanesulfonate monooxygenase SsuD/methylene tetrahydromethanopterin reductase-like flavin-dependent oxidoreductase (luciferase family)